VTLDEAETWMRPWQERIRPAIFGLVGGEPALHPQLPEFVRLSRRSWPDSLLVLTTNGLLLDRHPQLPAALEATGTLLRLTKHHDGPHYQAAFRGVVELLADWSRRHRFRTEILLAGTRWTRRYLGEGAEALPYDDGDPLASWQHCQCRPCRQLFRGRLWKCSLSGLGTRRRLGPRAAGRAHPRIAHPARP
jgi:hypothetical protein